MGANPDFIYASYRSAFQAKTEEDQKRIEYFEILPDGCELTVESSRGNATYCRAELDAVLDIPTYLQTTSCEVAEHRPEELTLDDLYQEINDIASIFGVQDNAEGLIATIEDHFQEAQNLHQGEAKPLSVLFLDSWSDETPYVGACCGSINTIIEYAGAVNVFSEVGLEDRATWARVNWTDIVEADPDVIITVDASWDKAGT
jgi:iron complex transport system substrate-binding protein